MPVRASSSKTPWRQNATCTLVHVRQSGESIGKHACARCAGDNACTNASAASTIGAVGTFGASSSERIPVRTTPSVVMPTKGACWPSTRGTISGAKPPSTAWFTLPDIGGSPRNPSERHPS